MWLRGGIFVVKSEKDFDIFVLQGPAAKNNTYRLN